MVRGPLLDPRRRMICDVVFDLPLHQSFAYAIPSAMTLHPGQRVWARLRGRPLIGVVIALRDGDEARLHSIERPVESVPILSNAALELGRWSAEESLSSLGSTLLALLPPPARGSRTEVVAPPPEHVAGHASPPELWVGAGREARLAQQLRGQSGSALVVAPDRERAARWAATLDAPRLDSGAPDAARRAAWFAASRGRARIVVGTRSAVLTPLPPPATLVLLDEHDPAHKPPGAPRMHARDLLIRRATLAGSRLLMLSATPSVESWWRADRQRAIRPCLGTEPWPQIITADTRRILRNHPITLPLTRTIEDMTRSGRRMALIVTRRSAALICTECGELFRCPECAVPLYVSRPQKALACRLCARVEPLPEHCPSCGGHRLFPFGWDAERVEAAVRKRFPKLSVSRADPRAQVLIGTPAILRALGPGTLGAVGVVTLDNLLTVPDFRGGERALELVWAAAETVGRGGRVIIQTLHPEHYAIQAVQQQDLRTFYEQEIKLRAELRYPPFSRLCLISVKSRSQSEAQARLGDVAQALRGITGLTVYPPAPFGSVVARSARRQVVIKGPSGLPRLIAPVLRPFLEQRRRGAGVVEVEMDPVS